MVFLNLNRLGASAGLVLCLSACQGVMPEPMSLSCPERETRPQACPVPEPAPECPPPPKPVAQHCQPAQVVEVMPPALRNKMIVGDVEKVFVEPANLLMDARIDSGATTTSLHAENIERFERDGKAWVRFQTRIREGNEPVTMELPIVRRLRIKSTNEAEDHRLVVEITLRLGSHSQLVEASLVDRAHFEYPLLVGRNFLRDVAVIDVGRQYLQGQ